MLRAHVDEVQLRRFGELELASLPRPGSLLNDVTLFVDLNRRLADRVAVFLPRRKIKRIRLVLGGLLTGAHQLLVRSIDLFPLEMIADVVIGVSGR